MISTKKNEGGYLSRNRWLVFLFIALSFLASLKLLKDMELGFQFPDFLTYALVTVLVIFAGIHNALSGTITAKIFRGLVVFGLIACALWFIAGVL